MTNATYTVNETPKGFRIERADGIVTYRQSDGSYQVTPDMFARMIRKQSRHAR